MEWLVAKKKSITETAGVLVALHPIINYAYNLCYQVDCEDFYGVPGKYFRATINSRLLYLTCILLIVMVIYITLMVIEKYIRKEQSLGKGSNAYAAFMTIVIGSYVGFFNAINWLEIVEQTYKSYAWTRNVIKKLHQNVTIPIMVIFITAIFVMLVISLINKIKDIKRKWIKSIINVIFVFSFMLNALLMVYGTIFKLTISIEDKTKYEFVTIEEQEYVVL